MKRTILSVIAISLIYSSIYGQMDRSFRFGLHGSPLLGWMKPDVSGYARDGSVINFNYGFSTEFLIATNYTFATGIDILYCGGKLRFPSAIKINEADTFLTEGNLSRKYRIQYLQIPLTIKMRTNEIGDLSFYGQFGFTTAFRLQAKADDNLGFETAAGGSVKIEGNDIKDQVHFFRAGLLIGLGAEYSLGGTTALCAGLNFNNGFTDVLKAKNPRLNTEENAISNFIELTLGVVF